MALREDYASECIDEINRKIKSINNIIDEIRPYNFDVELGLENSVYIEKIDYEVKSIINTLEDLKEILLQERRKIADDLKDL